eukprot:scaffold23285_cov113-Isochrysis_galbana.AAC.1
MPSVAAFGTSASLFGLWEVAPTGTKDMAPAPPIPGGVDAKLTPDVITLFDTVDGPATRGASSTG